MFGSLFNFCLESLGVKVSKEPAQYQPDEYESVQYLQRRLMPVVISKIYDWAKAENIDLHAIQDFTSFRNDIHFFYPTDRALKQYCEDGTSERLKQQFINAAREAGISEEAIEKWEFNFGSYEYVENHWGGYQAYFG